MRLLVVEDEVRMASLLRRGLEEEGYAVDVAGDGGEALRLASEHRYDALVLDAMIPVVDGFEVCRRLRRDGVWSAVLLLTARDSVRDRTAGLDAGADDYLTKPFAFAELLARLRALLRRGRHEVVAALTVGDLALDPAERRAFRGDAELHLTGKEFAVLELFMRNAGLVLSRERILEHAWDIAFRANCNIVDQYVSYLRRKVDQPFDRRDIETVRGAGYRLRSSRAVGA